MRIAQKIIGDGNTVLYLQQPSNPSESYAIKIGDNSVDFTDDDKFDEAIKEIISEIILEFKLKNNPFKHGYNCKFFVDMNTFKQWYHNEIRL